MKADTGASRNFLKEEDITKLVNVHKLIDGPIVILLNSVLIKATHKCLLRLHDTLSNQLKEALVYPGITNESLISIGQIYDNNCLGLFSKKNINILKEDRLILTGTRNSSDVLWKSRSCHCHKMK